MDGLSGRSVRPRDNALFLQQVCEASFARGEASSDILAADHRDAARSQAALRRYVMPGRLERSASSMPKNLRRPVRTNIMSAARSQPDRIGPLCPIPNQSSPRSITASAL